MARPRGKSWATMAIAGLALSAIAAGLLIAGGPAQGRAEQRDQRREQDLSRLENQLECLSRAEGALVLDPVATEACPMPVPPVDPVSGEPYRIEAIDDENLRFCADFETDAARDRNRLYTYPTTDLVDDQGCRVVFFPKQRYRPDR